MISLHQSLINNRFSFSTFPLSFPSMLTWDRYLLERKLIIRKWRCVCTFPLWGNAIKCSITKLSVDQFTAIVFSIPYQFCLFVFTLQKFGHGNDDIILYLFLFLWLIGGGCGFIGFSFLCFDFWKRKRKESFECGWRQMYARTGCYCFCSTELYYVENGFSFPFIYDFSVALWFGFFCFIFTHCCVLALYIGVSWRDAFEIDRKAEKRKKFLFLSPFFFQSN